MRRTRDVMLTVATSVATLERLTEVLAILHQAQESPLDESQPFHTTEAKS
jgi:hypothetical protein